MRLVYILAHDDQNKSESTALVKSTTMTIIKKLTLGVKYLIHRNSAETEDIKKKKKRTEREENVKRETSKSKLAVYGKHAGQ